MNLRQLRLQFRAVSGRYDLVGADGVTDQGADFYLNAGLRHLDRRSNFQKSPARSFNLLTAGQMLVKIQHCRAIQEVWVANQTSRWQLEKRWWQDFRATFTKAPSETNTGSTSVYCATFLRPTPEVLSAEELVALDWVTKYMEVVTDGTHQLYNGVLIGPPSTEDLMVEVVGLFYSRELSSPTDSNMWTELWPELVVQAACLELEKMHRNSQGVNDWNSAIEMSLQELDKDGVEEEISGGGQMKG